MRAVRFVHIDRNRTIRYRIEFYAPGGTSPVYSVEFSNVAQVAVNPPTYDAVFPDAQKPAPGVYEVTVTAIGPVGETTSARSAPLATETPLAAPGNVEITFAP